MRRRSIIVMVAWSIACLARCTPSSPRKAGSPTLEEGGAKRLASSEARHLVLRGGRLAGGTAADVEFRDGLIVAVGKVTADADVVDVSGRYLVPAFIDSHVHLAYLPRAAEMVAHGIAAAIDMAAPEAFLAADHAPIDLRVSGPMITSPGGYPLDSWGKDGYGVACRDAKSCEPLVDRLHAAGAALIKIPLTDAGGLDDVTAQAVVVRAHRLGLKVAVHALSERAAHRGAVLGADVLAHVPTEHLTEETLATWANRAVITTLSAFGGSAVENAAAFHKLGGTVLYGTDFGNTTAAGISKAEIERLVSAGFDGAAIVAAGTTLPASYWRFDHLGAIAVGKAASVLVLADDPLAKPITLASPVAVYVTGEPIVR